MDSKQITKNKDEQQEELLKDNDKGQSDYFTKKGYNIQGKLGSGIISNVFSAIQTNTQSQVAIKKVIDMKNKEHLEMFNKEKDILKKIKNEKYAIQILDDFEDHDLGISAIVLEYYDCNLANIFEHNKFTFEQLLAFSFQMLKGLSVFQENGIINGHIKPENIFFSHKKGLFVIADFEQKDQKMNENRNYQSPEVQKNEKPFTIMADVFTVGLFLIQGFIKRDLTSSELLNLRSKNLFEAVPELKQSQDNKFITEIVSHMVNHEKQQRLEPTKLLENLKEFQFNENCLQNLKLNQNTSQDKNTEKNISNEKSSQINNAKKIHPELIQENKDATEQTQAQLGKTLSQNQNVDSITFSKENNVSETSDLSSCKEVILKYRNAFEKQYCFFTKFGVENVTKAICCLSPNKNIKSLNLDLSGNKIGKKGIKLIATDLEKLTNLTTLNLDLLGNSLGEEGSKEIGDCLKKLKDLSSLNLSLTSNNIGSNGTIEICKCIEELKDLTSLSLHLIQNGIDSEGAKQIGKSLEKLQNLSSFYLNLYCNKIDASGAKQIGTSLEKLKNLSTLNLIFSQNQFGKNLESQLKEKLSKVKNVKIVI